MTRHVYTCAYCMGEFDLTRSSEEALAEAKERWPHVPVSQMSLVCEDCFEILAFLHAEEMKG